MFMLLLISLSSQLWSSSQDLEVKIQGMKSNQGHILYLLFNGEEGFPDEPSKSVRQGKVRASEAEFFLIKDLEAGHYALSIIHDENDNDKLDTNFLGIPREGVGFSNNPGILFGAPAFKKCEFTLTKKETLEIQLKHF